MYMEEIITNEQRRYLGLEQIGDQWDVVEYCNRQNSNDHIYLLFDGDMVRRRIIVNPSTYQEDQIQVLTAANRTIVLPKTKRGKPKTLNFTAAQAMAGEGTYFYAWGGGETCSVGIANYTTQQTYIFEEFHGKGSLRESVQTWLHQWIADTTEQDMEEIERFKTAKRKHQQFKVGDFFAFKISRREWGYGRILIDVSELRKDPHFVTNKNYGLTNLMGRALIVHLYHKIGTSPDISVEELSHQKTMPAQAVMDNRFFYGDYPIIGYLPLSADEYEPLVSLGRSLDWRTDSLTVYLQYGLIYRETTIGQFPKEFPDLDSGQFRNEGIGFQLHFSSLRQCIAMQSNEPYWQTRQNSRDVDLRNPKYAELKRRLFDFFGLDAGKSYAENLNWTLNLHKIL